MSRKKFVSPIIFKTKVIESFDSSLTFPIGIRELMLSKSFVTNISSLFLVFTFDDETIQNQLFRYFDPKKNIPDFVNLVFCQFKQNTDISIDSTIFTKKENNFFIGKDSFENQVYFIDNTILIKKYKKGYYCSIEYSNSEALSIHFPLVIKVIESIISDYFFSLGFLPIHSSIGINRENGEVYMVLGASHSGKTSYFLNNRKFEILGDEVTYYREDKVIPFNLYYKEYVDNISDENYYGISRKVKKIESSTPINKVDKIIITTQPSRKDLTKIRDNDYKIAVLIENLQSLPGEIFLSSENALFPLMINAINRLLSTDIYLK